MIKLPRILEPRKLLLSDITGFSRQFTLTKVTMYMYACMLCMSVGVCTCVCACVCACVLCACVRACVRSFVWHVCACVYAISRLHNTTLEFPCVIPRIESACSGSCQYNHVHTVCRSRSHKWLEIGNRLTQALKNACPLRDSTMYCVCQTKAIISSGQNSHFSK